MQDQSDLRAIICEPDGWHLRALESLVTKAGFVVAAETKNAIETLRETEFIRPQLVVVANELEGLSGLEIIADLRAIDTPPEVILISTHDGARVAAKDAGAYELAVKGEADMLGRVLDEIYTLVVTGERRASRDRRVGERRKHQDWSKVTHERRSGTDRRGGLRREHDVTSTAKDILKRRQDH